MRYAGLAAFGDDAGTLWTTRANEPLPLSREVSRRAASRPIVWFVDDERSNREWFAAYHRKRFPVITFSSRRHVMAALRRGTPCDAVVTDIFFPASPPRSDSQADKLLRIYKDIARSRVGKLASVWKRWRRFWSLDGFTIARDVARHAQRTRRPIPVFLFSRKAVTLLSWREWLTGPDAAVQESHWILEKIDPNESAAASRRAARIQYHRIVGVLRGRARPRGRRAPAGPGRMRKR